MENQIDFAEIFFGVYADRIDGCGLDVDAHAILKETKLFEAFGALKLAWGELGKAAESIPPVGVEADVLPVLRMPAIAVEGDRGA